MPKDLPTLRAKLTDLGLDSFVRGAAFWEGEHVRLVLTPNDSKRLTKELVSQVSASLRKIGCIEKKLNIWNELVEKVNTDFDETRKEFWAFVGRKSKGKKKKYSFIKE